MHCIKYLIRYTIPMLLTLGPCACEDHEIDPDRPVQGNYFPMTEGSYWEYVTKYHCYWPDTTLVCYDTAQYFAKGDPLPGDAQYKPLSAHYGTFKWIKNTNDQYYALGAYVPAHKFLDATLPLNSSWVYDNGLLKEKFSIISINTTKAVNGTNYGNVIGVLKTDSWRTAPSGLYEEVSRSYHYYAKDVGEIYSYHPNTPFRENGDIEVFLIDYFISP